MTLGRPPAGRDLSLDAVRAVALLSMYVAHFAPSDGPGAVLGLSEYLTAPLFAFLIGWSAQLGLERGREGLRAVLVRGAVVLAIGLALEPLVVQIYVILPWLGLLVWASGLLVRLPSRWLVALAALLVAVEPVLLTRSREWLVASLPQRHGSGVVTPRPDQVLEKLVELLSGGDAYRLTWLVPVACLGVLVARHARDGPPARVVGLSACAASLLLLALGKADLVAFVPYSGRWSELLLDASLVLTVVFLVRALCARRPGLARLLAPAGAMTLSLYVVQVLASQAWVAGAISTEPVGGSRFVTDDSWLLLVLLAAGSLVLASLWRRSLSGSLWERGPLEGLVTLLTPRAGVRDRFVA